MHPATLPTDEDARLHNLRQYLILDTPPEKAFDSIVEIAAEYFQVPFALVGLIDQERQWFKACFGIAVHETERDVAFCNYTILDNKLLVVPDTTLDYRFKDNPAVTNEPYIRFYAGVPLHTPEGFNIGTLCLLDTQPRQFSTEQSAKLEHLATVVMVRLQLRLATLKLSEVNTKYLRQKEAEPSARFS